jgi:C4-dicarboxylate-specific signal transduction histidine kinase
MKKFLTEKHDSFRHFTESVDLVEKTVRQILQIVNGLVGMFRDSVEEPAEEVNVKTLIDEALAMTVNKLDQVQVVTVPSEKLARRMVLKGRRIQTLQILTNLIRNAVDALAVVKEPRIKLEAQELAHQITITVEDNGPGLPETVRTNLFKPGFSGKCRAEGAGLGLKISKTLAEAQGGRLFLDTSSPKTRFILELPKAG